MFGYETVSPQRGLGSMWTMTLISLIIRYNIFTHILIHDRAMKQAVKPGYVCFWTLLNSWRHVFFLPFLIQALEAGNTEQNSDWAPSTASSSARKRTLWTEIPNWSLTSRRGLSFHSWKMFHSSEWVINNILISCMYVCLPAGRMNIHNYQPYFSLSRVQGWPRTTIAMW